MLLFLSCLDESECHESVAPPVMAGFSLMLVAYCTCFLFFILQRGWPLLQHGAQDQ